MTLRHRTIAVLTAAALYGCTATAHADIASDMRADLQASGAPVTGVAIETPVAAAGTLDTVRAESTAFPDFRPYFSSNPSAPQPVARVTLLVGNGQPLAGILTTPGLSEGVFTDVQPKAVAWRLAAVEAVKHAVAAGASLSALQLDVQSPRGTWSFLQALPKTSVWKPRQTASASMTLDEVRSAASRALPAWAQPNATVEVRPDSAGERIVSVELSATPTVFALHNVRGVTDSLASVQTSMAVHGANIGRTMVWIKDTVTGDPLYTAGDDRLWGYAGEWISPRVEGLPGFQQIGRVSPPTSAPRLAVPDDAAQWTGTISPAPQVPR